MNWEHNKSSYLLPEIAVTDLISLYATEEFQYKIIAEIKGIDDSNIHMIVKSIFDAPTGSEISGGEILRIIGKAYVVPRSCVHDVIRMPLAN